MAGLLSKLTGSLAVELLEDGRKVGRTVVADEVRRFGDIATSPEQIGRPA